MAASQDLLYSSWLGWWLCAEAAHRPDILGMARITSQGSVASSSTARLAGYLCLGGALPALQAQHDSTVLARGGLHTALPH